MSHPQPDSTPDPVAEQPAQQPEQEPEQPAEPLNRAERRAQRRGKQAPAAPQHAGPAPAGGRQPQAMLPPRRAGRRGNR